MTDSKVWMVLGAEDGLGAAAIKYLVAKKQIIIAVIMDDKTCVQLLENNSEHLYVINMKHFDTMELNSFIANFTSLHGFINTIINNLNYQLFNKPPSKSILQINNDVKVAVSNSVSIVRKLMPFTCKEPQVHIISLPPQLCLATISDKSKATVLSDAMNLFLRKMQHELQELDCKLDFLQPGARLSELSQSP